MMLMSRCSLTKDGEASLLEAMIVEKGGHVLGKRGPPHNDYSEVV